MMRVMVFGAFDGLHEGHRFFLRSARQLGDSLLVVVARDCTVLAVKGRVPRRTELERQKDIQASGLADSVILGEEGDKYQVIRRASPDIIALGYDQKAFVDNLAAKIGTTTHIVRLPAFHPEIYKSSRLEPV